MKISKVFGVVLGLHFGVIAMLVFQPGCSTTTPPTRTYEQNRTTGSLSPLETRGPDGLIEAERVDGSIDDAFNAGIGDERFAPQRPSNEFSEFDDIEPLAPLEPLEPMAPAGPTIDIAESSYQTYTVQKGDSLWQISRKYSVSLNDIYAANGLSKSSILKVGQQIKIPVEGSSETATAVTADAYQPTTLMTSSTRYTVRSGDTLSKIAKKHGTSVREIKAANSKTSDMIRIGEQLVIPGSGTSAAATPAPVSTPAPSAISASGTHTVKSGEFPGKIAQKYGMTTQELLTINGISDPRSLQVGQVLKVGSGASSNIATSVETVPVSSAPAPVATAPAPTTVPAASDGPVEIRVIEADPLIEGESEEIIDPDSMFDNAVEIPVIRMEE